MKRYVTIFVLALTALVGAAKANPTISWGSNFTEIPENYYDNAGNIFDASYTFELGTFGTTFVPTLANIDQWQANWKLLSVGDWDVPTRTFGQSFSFNSNGTVQGLVGSATFTTNELAYVWVRSGQQWALVTDNNANGSSDPSDIWRLPDPSAVPGATPIWVINEATGVVMGGANGIQSGTPYAFDPGTNFRLQTAVVPEPGTSLLVLLAGCTLRFVRGRRVRVS